MSRPRAIVFGEGCFGLVHEATSEERRDVAVVICPTIGYEAVCSHRALRVLAEELASRGIAAVRFDYHGTGDSLGDDRLPHRVDAWIRSIDAAIDTARTETGAREVVVLGLRLGANLAAAAVAKRSDVSGLVLIAPCMSGRSFIRETRAFRLLAAAQEGYAAPAESDELDAAGFILSSETVKALTLLTWPHTHLARRALVIGRDDTATDAKVLNAVRAGCAAVEEATLPGYGAMMVDPHATVVPRAMNERIVEWVAAGHAELAMEAFHASVCDREHPIKLSGDQFVEEARWFGDADRSVFGIITDPATREPRRGTVILCNPGSVHHIGANRMHVAWARAWAAQGFSVARIDVGGIGESPAARGQHENETYSKSAVPDIEMVIRELCRTSDPGPLVLIGLCSGAYAAYHTALARRDARPAATREKLTGIVLINPQTFHFRAGDSLEVSPISESRRYRSSLFEASKWQRLFSGKVDVRNAAKTLVSLAGVGLKAQIDRRFGGTDVARELRSILELRTDVLLVYAAKDPGLDYLHMHVGRAIDDLRKDPRFHMELMPNADHTFTLVEGQRQLQTMLTAHLDRLGPRRAKKPTPPS